MGNLHRQSFFDNIVLDNFPPTPLSENTFHEVIFFLWSCKRNNGYDSFENNFYLNH